MIVIDLNYDLISVLSLKVTIDFRRTELCSEKFKMSGFGTDRIGNDSTRGGFNDDFRGRLTGTGNCRLSDSNEPFSALFSKPF